MLLTIEILDQDTLSWRTLTRHENVAMDAAPGIVATLREGLPAAAVLRWHWFGRHPSPRTRRGGFAKRRGFRRH